MLALCVSCGSTRNGVFESVGGKDDVAYLFFQSSGAYANKEVEVVLDEKTAFVAKVVKDRKSKAKYKGINYAIKPGIHRLKITYQGRILYNQSIVINSQQTKNIIL